MAEEVIGVTKLSINGAGRAVMSTLTEQKDARAFELGEKFAKEHQFSEFANDRGSERLFRASVKAGSPISYFDVFKYGAQSVWRARGEL